MQERLLVAALAEPPEAADAWRALQSELDLDRLEPGSFELLPLITRNLVEAGGDGGYAHDAHLARLKGIYRRSWVKNNLLLERVKTTAAELEAAGIRGLFVEGPTLATRYYPDAGLRPTSFFHVLVDEPSLERARARLPRAGWGSRIDDGDQRSAFSDAEGNGCTVGASLTDDFVGSDGSDPLEPIWSAAERQDLGESDVLVPGATDALLIACVKGARKHAVANVQWIADAALIVREGKVDWERIVEVAVGGGQTLRVRESLEFVARQPRMPVSAEALARLATQPVSRRERVAYAFAGGAAPWLGALPEILGEHLAATTGEPAGRAIATLPNRLQARWGLDHAYEIPLAAARRAYARLFTRGMP